jgi:NADP-dependent 3-hydroxy acid dehydrogenase YdfG
MSTPPEKERPHPDHSGSGEDFQAAHDVVSGVSLLPVSGQVKDFPERDVEVDVGNNLSGRTAVITGASSGIGEATARALAGEGAAVALLARRAERIDSLAAEITAAGGKAVACVADVRDRDAVLRARDVVDAALGPVHVLVNNAGVMLLSPFDSGKVDEWRRMIDTNLTAALLVTDVFLPQLIAAQGDIVNISSVAGRTTGPNSSVYNATKWGLTAWSDALRKELVQASVRVIVVEPGAVATELTNHISDEQIRAGAQGFYDSVGALQAEDIAAAIAFAVGQPHRVSLNEILIRPTGQAG